MKYFTTLILLFSKFAFANYFECKIEDKLYDATVSLNVDMYEYEDYDLFNGPYTKAILIYNYESGINYLNLHVYDAKKFNEPGEGKILNEGFEIPIGEKFEFSKTIIEESNKDRIWEINCLVR